MSELGSAIRARAGGRPRVDRDASRTRLEILRAAARLFARDGHAANINELERCMWPSKRMVYYYFNSKADLYRAVLERNRQALDAALERLRRDQSPPAERLERIVELTFDWFRRRSDAGPLAELRHQMQAALAPEIEALHRQALAEGKARPEITPSDITALIVAAASYCDASHVAGVRQRVPDQGLVVGLVRASMFVTPTDG